MLDGTARITTPMSRRRWPLHPRVSQLGGRIQTSTRIPKYRCSGSVPVLSTASEKTWDKVFRFVQREPSPCITLPPGMRNPRNRTDEDSPITALYTGICPRARQNHAGPTTDDGGTLPDEPGASQAKPVCMFLTIRTCGPRTEKYERCVSTYTRVKLTTISSTPI